MPVFYFHCTPALHADIGIAMYRLLKCAAIYKKKQNVSIIYLIVIITLAFP